MEPTKKIFYPGSFNPFSEGHADIVRRLIKLGYYVIIGIGINAEKESLGEEHCSEGQIHDFLRREELEQKAEVITYSGLTAQEAFDRGACCMARGVRSGTDFEYEFSIASANRDAFGIETLLLPADPSLSFVSSTIVRDLQRHGREDIAKKYLP